MSVAKGKKKAKKIKCFFCERPLKGAVTRDDYDEDETPDDIGLIDERYNRHVICAACTRKHTEGGVVTGADDDLEVDGKDGEKIKLSGNNRDVMLRSAGAALRDAVRLAEEEELDEADEFIRRAWEDDKRDDVVAPLSSKKKPKKRT